MERSNQRALVFLFEGLEPSEDTLKSMVETLAVACKLDKCKTALYDGQEIADMLLQKTVQRVQKSKQEAKKEDIPEESAALLIGTVFYEQLTKQNLKEFSSKLIASLWDAVYNKNNPALINAIRILATKTPSAKTRRKYHLTDKVMQIIKIYANIVESN